MIFQGLMRRRVWIMNECVVAGNMSGSKWIRHVDAAIHVDYPSLRSRSGKNGSAHGRGRCSCSASGFQATWGECAQPPSNSLKSERTPTQPHHEYMNTTNLYISCPIHFLASCVNSLSKSQHQRRIQHGIKVATRGSSRCNVG